METLPNSLGRLVTGLVREFLEFFDLEYSLAVFDPESDFVCTVYDVMFVCLLKRYAQNQFIIVSLPRAYDHWP
jgi:hypothetical protein